MKQLLSFVFKNLLNHPEVVEVVEEPLEEGANLYKVKIDTTDMGMAIGKGGRMIKSVRQLVRVKMVVEGKRAVVQLLEPGAEGN